MSVPFGSLEDMIASAAEAIRPAKRMTVAEAAEEYRYINNPGAYVGPWKNSTTPYLVEPMNILTSWRFTGMVFAGPAQCGKTDMFPNWLGYSAICDPADMMLIQTSQTTARDFSMRRIDRLHRHSPKIGERLLNTKQADNTFDKTYRSGMLLTLSWPTINELSGKPIPRLWLTDYDRMQQDVDGEGSPFFLARKRATTFRSNGMCAAESSPGFTVDNPKWVRGSKHEAPPTQGILAIYNQGDRRRWYWQCIDCHNWFEPAFDLLRWETDEDLMAAAESVYLECPHCGGVYHHDPRDGRPGKHILNQTGLWVPDYCTVDQDGNIHGSPPRSTIASFWLKGVAAAFSDWKTLVFNYLSALREYDRTMNEESLKATVNTDQGEAYVPKSLSSDRVPEALKARAKDRGHKVVPHGVRFLIATVDIQKHRFVVQVHGITSRKDIVVIDRFDVQKSRREDKVAGGMSWVNPGAYAEDWKLLVDEVMLKTYELGDGSGRRMAIKHTYSDSGGKAGVTANAYNFYRWLRWGDPEDQDEDAEEGTYEWQPGLAGRFTLVKGASAKEHPRVKLGFPDSQRKDRTAGARGEIPVLFINPNLVKDMLDHMLNRTDPGGQIEFPSWLDDNFFIELTVEVKNAVKNVWENPNNFRNESWDLLVYCIAGTLTPEIALEHMNFDSPPGWAEQWDMNDLVFDPQIADKPFSAGKDKRSLSDLAQDLA
jgi:phage terminase large subunit GpA-like protein